MRLTSQLTLLLLAALAAGCDRAEPPETTPAAAQPAAAQPAASAQSAQPTAAGIAYTIDPAASEVFWTIGRAGVAARFGHSHVISAEQFSGTATVDPSDLAASRFELEIPVADLVIDDPQLRSRLGDEFSSVPSEDDKAGTRRNMLSPQLLDGERYPVVRVRGGGPRTTDAGSVLPIEVEILGRWHAFEVPGEVVVGGGTVEASGEFALDHADLGLTPFSALGGALQVAETIRFSYRIRAVRAE